MAQSLCFTPIAEVNPFARLSALPDCSSSPSLGTMRPRENFWVDRGQRSSCFHRCFTARREESGRGGVSNANSGLFVHQLQRPGPERTTRNPFLRILPFSPYRQ